MRQVYSSSSLSSEAPARVNSCLNCRRRKIKCGGERPKCKKCGRSRAFQDCEYPEDGPTATQILNEQIALLEARIEELETPEELRTRLVLRNPYPGAPHSPPQTALSRGGSSVPVSGSHSRLFDVASSSSSLSESATEGIPKDQLEALINNFLQYSSQFGFFLNLNNFREAVMGRSGPRPTPFLLHVVDLFGIHLSGSEKFATYETNYLSRALRTSVTALSGIHRQNTILHTIQAEVLLSHYFLRNTRFLEGKYHLSAAVSLVVSSGMHRIRSADSSADHGLIASASRRLPQPLDATEEAERISAFWTVLTLNNCWTTADGSPSNISYTAPHARIDTPWPLDINAPGFHTQTLPDSNIGTASTFLANQPDSAVSVAALHAKAAILFEQASHQASQYRPNMSNEELTQFYFSLNSIDTLIETFKTTLLAIYFHPTREMLVIHSLVHVATIQLHNPFIAETDVCRVRVLDAARAIVAALAQAAVNEFQFIDPIMGTLLMATCQTFVTELGRLRRQRLLNSPMPQEEQTFVDTIESILAAMTVFAPRCRLMESQLATMQQLYHGLQVRAHQ
ncbi:hypothetical protein B0H19DRAFT_1365235 [Mycena capillaripes]|nr:hypothetical protein B0H19DRAFT_1365235 [Mycena capillaripes]